MTETNDGNITNIEEARAVVQAAPADLYCRTQDEIFLSPEGVSKERTENFFVVRTLMGKERTRFEKLTKKEIIIERKGDSMKTFLPTSEDKEVIIRLAIIGGQIFYPAIGSMAVLTTDRRGELDTASINALNYFLENANPLLIDEVYTEIESKNKWLRSGQTIEDIEKAINDLVERKQELIEEEAKKSFSGNNAE